MGNEFLIEAVTEIVKDCCFTKEQLIEKGLTIECPEITIEHLHRHALNQRKAAGITETEGVGSDMLKTIGLSIAFLLGDDEHCTIRIKGSFPHNRFSVSLGEPDLKEVVVCNNQYRDITHHFWCLTDKFGTEQTIQFTDWENQVTNVVFKYTHGYDIHLRMDTYFWEPDCKFTVLPVEKILEHNKLYNPTFYGVFKNKMK